MNTTPIKTLVTILLLASLALPCAPLSAGERNQPNAAKKQNTQDFLFVQSAQKAIIKRNEDKTYTLTLKQVAPYITYFSNRPERIVKSMPLTDFLELWQARGEQGFKGNPPNVAVNGVQIKVFSPNEQLSFVVELSDPHYNQRTKTLTYTAKLLPHSPNPLPTDELLHDITLFIDDVCLTCW